MVLPNTSFAETKVERGGYDLRFVSISRISANFDITKSGKAIISSAVTTYPSAMDFIKLDVTLQKFDNGSWKPVKSWNATSHINFCSIDKQYYVMSGHQYRTVTKVYTYKDGQVVETDTTITGSRYY